jgi:hypothetical protein
MELPNNNLKEIGLMVAHFNKICLCIDSCKSTYQLISTENMIDNFNYLWNKKIQEDYVIDFAKVLSKKVSDKVESF